MSPRRTDFPNASGHLPQADFPTATGLGALAGGTAGAGPCPHSPRDVRLNRKEMR
jgi:hypothetical protein